MFRALVLTILAFLMLEGCDPEAKLKPYRCLENINLQELMAAEGSPATRTGWSSSGNSKGLPRQKIFDLESETSPFPDLPDGYIGRLCGRLRTELTQRCEVRDFWESSESCAAAVSSPMDKITGPGGVYKLRGLDGRVNLFAARSTEGKKVVLTGTEWPG